MIYRSTRIFQEGEEEDFYLNSRKKKRVSHSWLAPLRNKPNNISNEALDLYHFSCSFFPRCSFCYRLEGEVKKYLGIFFSSHTVLPRPRYAPFFFFEIKLLFLSGLSPLSFREILTRSKINSESQGKEEEGRNLGRKLSPSAFSFSV